MVNQFHPPSLDEIAVAAGPDYTVEGHIKSGGQGSVFRASLRGEPVALKLFEPQAEPERLKRELQLLRDLKHPNLVAAVDSGVAVLRTVPVPFVSYVFVSGGDLSRPLQTGASLRVSELLRIGYEVACALEFLWQHRIVHRDVKPANVLVDEAGRYVLADVGFARHLDLNTITAADVALGTPCFMSPEQAAGTSSLTVRSDIFSLGVTLYALATHHLPWPSQAEVGRSVPPPASTYRDELPQDFDSIVARMLGPRAVTRPSKVSEELKQLMDSKDGEC